MKSFEKILGKGNPILKTIQERGFEAPSEIQEKSIPSILEGKDVIAGASTGSGKTLAFGAGLIQNVERRKGIQGLVLTPTRELAEQITKEITDFSKHKNLNILSVYGGVSIQNQLRKIGATEIVVGTPGRILDHLERHSLNFENLNTLVLDEADRMLDMGFIDDVKRIINECPNKRQTLLFSATISPNIARLVEKYMKNPVEISAKPHVDPLKLSQVYYDVDDNIKYSLLVHLLQNEKSKLVMIFCNTRKNVDFVSKNLRFTGLNAVPIHGGFSQEKRNGVLEQFKNSKTLIMVATDVAARGIDVKGISHVYNFDTPKTPSEYTHRIGRTARAGKAGKVINLIASRDYKNFSEIINCGEFNIKNEETPQVERVRIRWMPEKKHERFERRRSMAREREPQRTRRGSRGHRDSGRGSSRGPRRDGRSSGSRKSSLSRRY